MNRALEGWLNTGEFRRHHYFVGNRSLCDRIVLDGEKHRQVYAGNIAERHKCPECNWLLAAAKMQKKSG